MTFDLSPIDWDAVGAIFSILTAGLGGWIAFMVRKGQRQRETLNAFETYRKELLDFTNHVITALDRTRSLIANDPEHATVDVGLAKNDYYERRSELLGQVSSLIDRGRFLFPNRELGGFGQEKGVANRGLRDRVLDRVISAHHILQAVDYTHFNNNRATISFHSLMESRRYELNGRDKHLHDALQNLSTEELEKLARERQIRLDDVIVSAKRSFVSEMFLILQPEDWLNQVEEAYGIKLRSRGHKVERYQ